jgi:hypothetical protein
MAVDDHGLEVLKKSGLDISGNKTNYALQVSLVSGSSSNTTPTINNILVATANVEQSFSLPADCKGFLIKARQNCRMKFSYALNGTTSSWLTIGLGGYLKDDNKYSSQDIYFQVDRNNTDIEIVTYI